MVNRILPRTRPKARRATLRNMRRRFVPFPLSPFPCPQSPVFMPAIIVLGGHRCGTSSIAGAISHLGVPAALPGDGIGASPSNPRGHFEDRTLVRLHGRMLGPGGWRDPLPAMSLSANQCVCYDAHLNRRATAAACWLIKDPRLCLLLPFLLERLQRLEIPPFVVSVSRDLAAVADSLRRRQRMSISSARRIAGLYEGARRAQLGWLAARPSVRLLQLEYEHVLADRDTSVATLAEFLRVAPTSAAVQFLDPALRHG